MITLAFAITLIVWRCAYRLGKLNRGCAGSRTFDQSMFLGMKPGQITAAIYSIATFHPAVCMGEGMGRKKTFIHSRFKITDCKFYLGFSSRNGKSYKLLKYRNNVRNTTSVSSTGTSAVKEVHAYGFRDQFHSI